MKTPLTVGSLFSGIGGLDIGLERAGMRVLWQCESDPYCRAVLRKHWPDVPCYEDVRALAESSFNRRRPRREGRLDSSGEGQLKQSLSVDVLAGGFPCQPVSVAGRQRAQADERWLWPEFTRLIRLLRPRYALLENVPGLLIAQQGRAAQEVFGDLAALGYDAEWDCVAAAHVGAPHLRYRVFIVAYPARDGGAEQEASGPEWERTRTRRQPITLANPDTGRRDGWSRIFGEGWRREPSHRRWWKSEPGVGRVAHGVPSRVDRLRALGNAVVPQVAEVIGRLIVEHAEMTDTEPSAS